MDRVALIEQRNELLKKIATTEEEQIEISEDIAGIDEQIAEIDFFEPKLSQEEIREIKREISQSLIEFEMSSDVEKPDLGYCDYSELED